MEGGAENQEPYQIDLSQKGMEEALEWLYENAEKLAEAMAFRKYVEEYSKSAFRVLTANSGGATVSDREADAYSSEEYKKIQSLMFDAVKEEELIRAQTTARRTHIDVWRTLQANRRVV